MKTAVSASVLAMVATFGSQAALAQPHENGHHDSDKIATVEMAKATANGPAEVLGEIVIRENEFGLVFEPKLQGLKPGLHGFHLHENASCAPLKKDGKVTPAGAAGSHFDPEKTGEHGTPWGSGHLGDLPALYVNDQGVADEPVLAPRLDADDLDGHALMIHAGGDNYSDEPKPLGGGGSRVACGVIER